MTDTLRNAAEHAMAFASECFTEAGCVKPMWIAHTVEDGEEKVIAITAMFRDDDEKEAAAAYIKTEIAPKAYRLIFICEAWMRVMKTEYDGLRPSEAPDSIECVYLTAEDVSGRQVMISRKIVRPKGKPPHLLAQEVHEEPPGKPFMTGRFTGLLNRVGIH